jgi:hypothetical protein
MEQEQGGQPAALHFFSQRLRTSLKIGDAAWERLLASEHRCGA